MQVTVQRRLFTAGSHAAHSLIHLIHKQAPSPAMPEFLVDVHTPPAPRRRLRVSAQHESALAGVLGVHPAQLLHVQPLAQAPLAWRGGAARIDARLFAQELAVLLDAGVPLLDAIDTLQEKAGSAESVLVPVAAALRRGQSLSVALAQAPGSFDSLFRALVAASERSGQLATALRHHASYLAWSAQLRSRLLASAIYPALLLASGLVVVLFLLLFVLPRFAGVFDGLGRELPLLSRLLLDLGVAAAAHPGVALVGVLMLPLALIGLWASTSAREALLALAWRLPGLGRRLRTLALARLYRCVGLLAAAGVPVPQALRLAEDVLAAPLRPALRAAMQAVDAGQRLSQALQQQGLATPVALRMLRVGEGSGALAPMLERAAGFHDEELAQLSELVSRFINPVLMLVMGTVIGGIVVLMYLPIFTLMEQVQ